MWVFHSVCKCEIVFGHSGAGDTWIGKIAGLAELPMSSVLSYLIFKL